MKECPKCKHCFPDEINHCPQDGDPTTSTLLGEPILDARYLLERRLGQGGMGVVFKARHIFLKTSHAIKIILPDLVGNDPMLVTRFRQEALAAAAIRHQNIIAVTDFGVVRGTMPFLVMEFVNGRSLQDILAEEKIMEPPRALEFISAIGAGVSAAHRQKIVHRDLKPLNIMVQNETPVAEGVKILDFGLAKIKSVELLGSFVQAQTTGMVGSPFYMAPEQWSDEEPDSHADIYSLGVILYQMLSGDVPFKGTSIPSIMKKHLTQPPPTFRSKGLQVPPPVEAVVRHALEKERSARPSSVETFLAELREAITSTGAALASPRRTSSLDVHQTITSPSPAAVTSAGDIESSHSEPAFGSVAGTIAEAGIDDPSQRQVSAAREAYVQEQATRERIAHEELAREVEVRKRAEQEAEKKRKEEEERVRKEKEEQEEQDRLQREQIERVARQANELEEKLARLAISVPPQLAAVDPEATQLQAAIPGQAVGNSKSFAGVEIPLQQSSAGVLGVSRKPARTLLMITVLVLLLGGGVAGYLILKWKPSFTSAITNTPANQNTAPGIEHVKADLVEIPTGSFQMGRNNGPFQERPEHAVTVQTFYMDRTEVTNEEYAEFVHETNYEAPSDWLNGKPLPSQEKWPVVNVSPIDAQAFAKWRSQRDRVTYRLPTEEEWEYAASNGGQYKLYPWGNRWEENRAVVKEASPRPVGSYPEGANRWGVVDLIGNVWEWTSSTPSLYSGDNSLIPAGNRNWVIARGGSYTSDPNDRQIPISATYRDWFEPTLKQPNYGFRLVRSGP